MRCLGSGFSVGLGSARLTVDDGGLCQPKGFCDSVIRPVLVEQTYG